MGVAQDVDLPVALLSRVALDPAARDPAGVDLDRARGAPDKDAGPVVAGNVMDLFWSALLDGLYIVQIHWMLMRIGNFGFLPALLFQIPLVFFVSVFGLSLLRIFFMRKVHWKGRTVNTKKQDSNA